LSLHSSGIKTKVIQNYKKPGRMLDLYISLTNSFDITCSITPCSRVLLEKLTGSKLVKKFPAFFGTRRFITAFTNACHMPLS
jgi:tRNA(Glu) U13 pseudouridine synthase TruD